MKKILAIILAIVMTLSLSTVSFAAESKEANDALESINTGTLFIQKVYETIHLIVHGLSRVFDNNCPMCNVVDATVEDFADVLAAAAKGEVVSLDAGDYGVITLGTIDGVGIAAKDGAVVTKIVTTAETNIKDVTLSGFDFVDIQKNSGGIEINFDAVIENLVIEDITFTGTKLDKSSGIRGYNPNATIIVKNCTFTTLNYGLYSTSSYGYTALTFEKCSFNDIKSWVIMGQSKYYGDLTITECTFDACVGGISKCKPMLEENTFTFTNNIVGADCKGHDGKDSKWFEMTTANAVIEGNTFAGEEWIPGAAQGIAAL